MSYLPLGEILLTPRYNAHLQLPPLPPPHNFPHLSTLPPPPARSVETALTIKDQFGRVLTPKERFRELCYQFHGKVWTGWLMCGKCGGSLGGC